MRSLVVGVFVKGGEWIEGHVLCESKPVLDAHGFAIHDKPPRDMQGSNRSECSIHSRYLQQKKAAKFTYELLPVTNSNL